MIKLDDINWSPPDRQLRQFGGMSLFAFPFLAWMWGGSPTVIAASAGVGFVLASVGWVWPQRLKPVFLGLTIAAIPIGIVVGEIAMLIVFFGVMLPIGLLLRLLDKGTLELDIDRSAKSYWTPKKKPRDVASYYHQS